MVFCVLLFIHCIKNIQIFIYSILCDKNADEDVDAMFDTSLVMSNRATASLMTVIKDAFDDIWNYTLKVRHYVARFQFILN